MFCFPALPSLLCLATGRIKYQHPYILHPIAQLPCGAIDAMKFAVKAWGMQLCDGRDTVALVNHHTPAIGKLDHVARSCLPVRYVMMST